TTLFRSEKGGSNHVAHAVYGVRTPDNRDAGAAVGFVYRGMIVVICHLHPVFDRGVLVAIGRGASTVEDRTQVVVPDVISVDIIDLLLKNLAEDRKSVV